MRRKRAGATILAMWMAVVLMAAMGCQPAAVNVPAGEMPTVVVKTVREEDAMLRYSITANYPQLVGALPVDALAKVNKAIEDLILPSIAGLKQDAADAAAWAAKNPSDAAELPADQGSFLGAEYEIPYLTSELASIRLRFQTYSEGAAHGMSSTRVLNVRLADGSAIDTEGLFKDAKQGLQWLSQYCAADLKRQYGADYEALRSFVDNGTAPLAENFRSVSLEPGGLVVSFDPYQVGPYASGPREVHIPLAEVQPMLSVTLSPTAFSLVLESVP